MGNKRPPANSLAELSINYGLPEPIKNGKQVTIHNKNVTLVFTEDSRRMLFNDTVIMMNGAMVVKRKYAILNHIDITDTLPVLLAPQNIINNYQLKTIILDPGHGGSDPGTTGISGIKEKDIVLDIAKRCYKKLQGNNIKILMTRKKDKAVSLQNRVKFAAKNKADLYISIHINSSQNKVAHGVETHIMPVTGFPCTAPSHLSEKSYRGNKFDKTSLFMAYSIHHSTVDTAGAFDRGIKRSRFYVLRNAPCPTLLIECGFVSNKKEENNLKNPVYRDKIATGIANGIKKWCCPDK